MSESPGTGVREVVSNIWVLGNLSSLQMERGILTAEPTPQAPRLSLLKRTLLILIAKMHYPFGPKKAWT